MKLFKTFLLVIFSVAILSACSNDDATPKNKSKVQVALKTSTIPTLKSAVADALVIEKFQINISEIEFDIEDELEDEILNGDSVVGSTEFDGPFLIDLLSDEASAGLVIGTANLPNAIYEEVEFEFDVYTADAQKELFGSSVLVKGTYNNTPFIIKSDEEWDIEIEFTGTEGYNLTGADSKVWIDFNLQKIKDQINLMDFANAQDADGNGIIVIDSEDTDGNAPLLDNFIEALEDAFDVEEEDENEDDDEDED